MPWRCPACGDPIQHAPDEEMPRERTVYRCLVCRLELTLDPNTRKLALSPLPTEPLKDRLNPG